MYNIAEPNILLTLSQSEVDGSGHLTYYYACSLAVKQIRKVIGDDSLQLYQYHGVIEDILIKKHHIVIISVVHYLIDNARLPLYPCIVDSIGGVSIFSFNPQQEFNKMIATEDLKVTSYDCAEEIARLFVRMMMPIISDVPIFFLNELGFTSSADFLANTDRSELKERGWELVNSNYVEIRRKFIKNILKAKWFSMVSKKENKYTVSLLTVGLIYRRSGWHTSYCEKLLNWEVIVDSNGLIRAKLPKGINVPSFVVNE
jgi:hypothetical protein